MMSLRADADGFARGVAALSVTSLLKTRLPVNRTYPDLPSGTGPPRPVEPRWRGFAVSAAPPRATALEHRQRGLGRNLRRFE
jgi:hypothetical protein